MRDAIKVIWHIYVGAGARTYWLLKDDLQLVGVSTYRVARYEVCQACHEGRDNHNLIHEAKREYRDFDNLDIDSGQQTV